MRAGVFAVVLAGSAWGQTAAQVCGRIPFADQKVACMRAISGHDVDAEAASVCGTIPFADHVVSCLSAAVDRRYAAGTLAACATIPFAEQKVECVRAAGQRRPARGDDDDADGDDRRDDRRSRRRRDDDNDDGPRARRRRNADTSVAFENHSRRVTAVRFFWRTRRGEWNDFPGRQRLEPGETLRFDSGAGRFDFCVQTSDGRSALWPRIDVDADERRLSFRGDELDELPCRDR